MSLQSDLKISMVPPIQPNGIATNAVLVLVLLLFVLVSGLEFFALF